MKPLTREELPTLPNNAHAIEWPWVLDGVVYKTHGVGFGHESFGPADVPYLKEVAAWLETANGLSSPPVPSFVIAEMHTKLCDQQTGEATGLNQALDELTGGSVYQPAPSPIDEVRRIVIGQDSGALRPSEAWNQLKDTLGIARGEGEK